MHIPLLVDHQGRRLAKRDKDLDLTALSQRFTSAQILGMLAYSAGILPEIRPTTLEKLLPVLTWDKVKKDDFRLPVEICR